MAATIAVNETPALAPTDAARADEAAASIHHRWPHVPRVGLILGTGLGNLATGITDRTVIPYGEIPYFPRPTAISHAGRLVCGRLHGVPVVAMEGRCHVYEGYSFAELGLPVLTMRRLGAERLIVSNAGGGMNPRLRTGDIVVLVDHVNLMGRFAPGAMPEVASQADVPRGFGLPRGPSPYDAEMTEWAFAASRAGGFPAWPGTYVAVTGPNYETRAEYRCFRRWGDVVGMSTVPEVLAAARCGLRVLALSAVTNVAKPDVFEKVDAEEVVVAAAEVEPRMRHLVQGVLETLSRA